MNRSRQKLFDLMGYTPQTPEVCRYHASLARLRIVCAPARTSKSYAAAHDSVAECIPEFERVEGRWKPKRSKLAWLIGPDFSTLKEFDYVFQRVVEGPISKLARVEKAQNAPQQGNMIVVLNWGKNKVGEIVRSVWRGMSATNERSLQGDQPDDVILSEAAEHPEKIWTRYLGTRYGRATWPTTPKVRALWIKQTIEMARLDDSLSIENFQFTPECNPEYDWERFWIEHQKAESNLDHGHVRFRPEDPMGGFHANRHHCLEGGCRAAQHPFFAEQFLGQWVLYEGRVVPLRTEAGPDGEPAHVLAHDPDWLDDAKWFWSFDYGYRDPTVGLLFALGPDGTIVIVDEIYEAELTEQKLMDRVAEKEREHGSPRIEFYVGDPKRPQVEGLLQESGLPVYSFMKNRLADRVAGKRLLLDRLATDPAVNRPMLFVHRRCRETIREWLSLQYREDAKDENSAASLIGDDHAFDCVRYGLQASRSLSAPIVTTRYRLEMRDRAMTRYRRQQRRIPQRELCGNPLVMGAVS